jgi:hypothetical protein
MSDGDILIAAATIMAALIKNEPERFKVPADQVNAAKTYPFLANELWELQKAIAKAKVNEEVERIAS